MTILVCDPVDYAGETLTIAHTAELPNGDPLTPDMVVSVTIAITLGSEVIEAETLMTWNVNAEEWQYQWNTTDLDPGWYRIQVWITDIAGGKVWEYKTVRLAPTP